VLTKKVPIPGARGNKKFNHKKNKKTYGKSVDK